MCCWYLWFVAVFGPMCRSSIFMKMEMVEIIYEIGCLNFMEPCELINFQLRLARKFENEFAFFHQRMDELVSTSKSAGNLHYRVFRAILFLLLFFVIENSNEFQNIISYLLLSTTDLVHRTKECSKSFPDKLTLILTRTSTLSRISIELHINCCDPSPCSKWNRKSDRCLKIANHTPFRFDCSVRTYFVDYWHEAHAPLKSG